MAASIVCFGELLLRMSAPGNQRLMQLPELNVHVGGAEANVAVSLARFGHTARMVSCLPDNPLGEAILQDLRGQGIDTTHIQTGDGRVGLYFLETGAVQRPSRIVYDRAHSAFVSRPADAYDWRSILQGAGWLHISGITPATGPNAAEAALQATRTATELGVRISFDGNYREQLWKAWSGNGPEILAELLSHASLAFINELDVGLIFGESHSDRADAEAAVFARLPRLQHIASTLRHQVSADHHRLTGRLATRDGVWVSREFDMPGIVDRIGGGDAFAGGLLHMLTGTAPLQDVVEFATASAVIKHSVAGDYNRTRIPEVEDLLSRNGLDVRR
jgi:2-dehydro-3-deoxygluconokinase